MAKINERIKEMRIKNNLTLAEVADYLGVTEATAQRYESGSIKTIKHDIICKLADFFKCDPGYLMGWSNNNNAVNSTITNSAVVQGNHATNLIVKNDGSKKLSNQATELLRIFESLDIKKQTELLSFAFELEENSEK